MNIVPAEEDVVLSSAGDRDLENPADDTKTEYVPGAQPIGDDVSELPGWLRLLAPMSQLPLWGQAAVLSAGVATLIVVLSRITRWVLRLGDKDLD
jgi:hypothetical protein